MEIITNILSHILHIDTYLVAFVSAYGFWTYLLLFAVIFCETGLIVTPFLPGDSLLFAAGSLAASAQSALDIQLLLFLLITASILGNKLNYFVGRFLGPKVFSIRKSWLFNPSHLEETHHFYAKHGGKTIILARFLPIIRTFAPFIAGIGQMNLAKFSAYNFVSALLWVGSLTLAGYYFGNLPYVKEHFSLVIYGIIALSLLPPTVAFLQRRFARS